MSDQAGITGIPKDDEPDDIRGALTSAISEIEDKSPGSMGNLAAPAKADVEKKTAAAATVAPKDAKPAEGTERGPDGKFLPKGAAPAAATATPDKNAPPAPEGTDKPVSDGPPGTLPANIKAEWETYPPSVKAFIAKRETDLSQAAGKAGFEINRLTKQWEPVEAIIGPRRAAIVAQQGSVENWLDQLVKYSDFAGADPEGFMGWFLSQPNIASRVNLEKLLGAAPQGGQQGAALANDPVVKQLQQTITGLTSRLQQFESGIQQQRVNSDISELDAFEAEKDQAGSLAHPHYAALRDNGQLGPEIQIVRNQHPEWSVRQVIAQAYENAVWKNPETRTQLLTTQEQKAREEKEAKDRAAAASTARKFVTGNPPGPTSPPGTQSNDLRAEIAANYYKTAGEPARL